MRVRSGKFAQASRRSSSQPQAASRTAAHTQADHPEPLPRRQQVAGLLRGLPDQRPGHCGQVGVDVGGDRAGDQADQRRHHEDQPDHGGDRPGRVPDQPADRQREQAEHGEVEDAADGRPQDPGLARW